MQDPNLPTSIYEIEGAKQCAIEFCSYSKTAGFTGVRCGYTIVPLALTREDLSLNQLWLRRQTTKFNGVSYIVQKGAAAIYTPEGEKEIKENIQYYLENARLIREALSQRQIQLIGGVDSPYIWIACPDGKSSWEYFDELLEKAQVVGTPGIGFGTNGDSFLRLTAFNSREKVLEAIQRILAMESH